MAMLYLRNKPIGAVSGGGSGGGHVIENASGTELAQRDTLKFSGYLQATDDSTNEKSVVSDAPNEVEYSVWQTMTDAQKAGKKWIIKNVPKTGGTPTDNSVSVTADGVKTYATLLNELYALIDANKITRNSLLQIVNASGAFNYSTQLIASGRYFFTYSSETDTAIIRSVDVQPSNSAYRSCVIASDTTVTHRDNSSTAPASGTTFTLYYNIVASAGVGDVDAGDVSFDTTVKNILPNTATDCQKAIDALSSPNYVILARTDSSVSLSNQNIGKYKFLILATEYGSGILATSVIPTGFFVDYPPLSAHATPQVGNTKNIYAKIDSVSGTLSSCSFTVTVTNPSGDSNFKALLFGVY